MALYAASVSYLILTQMVILADFVVATASHSKPSTAMPKTYKTISRQLCEVCRCLSNKHFGVYGGIGHVKLE